MSEQLKPCPFCGLVPDVDNPATFRHEVGDRWARVVCCIEGPEIRAGIYTPLEEWKDEAIAAWNERAPNVEIEQLRAYIAELEAQLMFVSSRVQDSETAREAYDNRMFGMIQDLQD